MGSEKTKDYLILPTFFSLSYRVDITSFIKRNTKEGQVEGDDEFIVRCIDFEVPLRYLKCTCLVHSWIYGGGVEEKDVEKTWKFSTYKLP